MMMTMMILQTIHNLCVVFIESRVVLNKLKSKMMVSGWRDNRVVCWRYTYVKSS